MAPDENWLTFWLKDSTKSMLFPLFMPMDMEDRGHVPETTNAQESVICRSLFRACPVVSLSIASLQETLLYN